jgi:hypothetical protein
MLAALTKSPMPYRTGLKDAEVSVWQNMLSDQR